MSDFEEKLNSILSDPEAMAQIASLAQSISGQGGSGAPEGAPPPPENSGAADPSALLSQLGGLDPELLRRLIPLMRQLDRPESGEAAELLRALRPFLSEARRGKIERATQLARLIHLGKGFLTGQEEAEHV